MPGVALVCHTDAWRCLKCDFQRFAVSFLVLPDVDESIRRFCNVGEGDASIGTVVLMLGDTGMVGGAPTIEVPAVDNLRFGPGSDRCDATVAPRVTRSSTGSWRSE